jgi:hypothetical protein
MTKRLKVAGCSASPPPQTADNQSVPSDTTSENIIAPTEEQATVFTIHANNYETSADCRWVEADDFRVNHAPKVNGETPSNRTLQDWRYKGQKAKDGKSGCDAKGHIWERDKFNPTIIRYKIKHE